MSTPHPALPPSPSPFPARASMLHGFAGAPLPSHTAAALWSHQARGHPRGLLDHLAGGLSPSPASPSSAPAAGRALAAAGDGCRVGRFTSRSSGFRPASFLKAKAAVILQRRNYMPESCCSAMRSAYPAHQERSEIPVSQTVCVYMCVCIFSALVTS